MIISVDNVITSSMPSTCEDNFDEMPDIYRNPDYMSRVVLF